MRPSITFHLFRHGQTDWNAENRIQGSTDIPLNETGRAQALALAAKLGALPLCGIVSSPLARAHETARIVATHAGAPGTPILLEHDLREVWFGLAEGRTQSELVAERGEAFWMRWRSMHESDLDFDFLEGESKRAAQTRALSVLERVARAHAGTAVEGTPAPTLELGVSTHGGIVRFLVHAVDGRREAPVPVENCCVHAIGWFAREGRFRYLGAH